MRNKYFETDEEACPDELASVGWTGLTIMLLPAAAAGCVLWLLF